MPHPLATGTVLKRRYQIVDLFGWAEDRAAYLARELGSEQDLVLWESTELFDLDGKPSGASGYFEQDGRHYLALQLRNQSLAFMLHAAGRIDEMPAGLWTLQICRSVGYWHQREEGPLVCLRQGSLALSSFRLSEADLVILPPFGDLCTPSGAAGEVDDYYFSAPERDPEDLSPRSDVYALGAMLYCLLTGTLPPDAASRAAREVRLEPPRKINREISTEMEAVVLRALELEPRARYPTAAELADELERFLMPRLQRPEEEERRSSLLLRAAPFLLILILIILFVVALVIVIGRPP